MQISSVPSKPLAHVRSTPCSVKNRTLGTLSPCPPFRISSSRPLVLDRLGTRSYIACKHPSTYIQVMLSFDHYALPSATHAIDIRSISIDPFNCIHVEHINWKFHLRELYNRAEQLIPIHVEQCRPYSFSIGYVQAPRCPHHRTPCSMLV